MWYLQGKGLLCGMYLQKSMAEAFYVEYDFFFGDFSNVKKYPTTYDSDVYRRIGVLTKEDKTLTGLIDYIHPMNSGHILIKHLKSILCQRYIMESPTF